MTLDHFIGDRYKIAEIKIGQTVLDHILNAVILLSVIHFTVKLIGDFEVDKVSRHLNG